MSDQTVTPVHPLEFQWTLYYKPPHQPTANLKQNWMAAFKPLYSFKTLEEFFQFWIILLLSLHFFRLSSHVLRPIFLPLRTNYYLFKEDILPAWEDPKNVGGGSLTICFMYTPLAEHSEFIFMTISLLLLGNTIPNMQTICGLCYSKSKEEIELWISSEGNSDVLQRFLMTELSVCTPVTGFPLTNSYFRWTPHVMKKWDFKQYSFFLSHLL